MIIQLFEDFHSTTTDTEHLNRALIVLLPKKESVGLGTPNTLRQISLQNCPIEAATKLLTNRLKLMMPLLVHGD